jgi:transcriptional regulator with XRE-family HTH domain
MKELGLSQAELGRRVGVSQPAIHALITRNKTGTRALHVIARELGTSPAYLTGEIDDPDANAPPPRPEPVIHHVMLPVALPSENALARMFEGLLRTMDLSAPLDEVAHELATLLPTGLSQLKGLLPASDPARSERRAAAAPALATDDREPRP